ncbi:5-formyltetrahydrofolate cyclo-ligase [Rhizobium sp. TH2]|uniref:5-formyltetrahydrofolate cyclo-ligase n=1 Tax=Rhizobium sp. TH2 TaxID=2775403 RepID=UPI002157D622|nr:5-formyltetrahydrofolate cyclo-ligase [Rhizobium sp. TH2]UVC07652.1 5-formyltetrahydrofolate cyclo-ligase [Rhizobium sp. TH2]
MISKALKAQLRAERLAARDAIPTENRIEKSMLIADAGGEGIVFEPGQEISGFFPIRSEVDVRPLMQRLKDRGGRLSMPVVVNRHTIIFRELIAGAPLVKTGFGTSGPGPEARVVDPDVMLVPLSAYDRLGHRIGYGAGFYDRVISDLHARGKRPQLIGVAFDCQEIEVIPAEDHDVALDAILTESGLKVFGKELA